MAKILKFPTVIQLLDNRKIDKSVKIKQSLTLH